MAAERGRVAVDEPVVVRENSGVPAFPNCDSSTASHRMIVPALPYGPSGTSVQTSARKQKIYGFLTQGLRRGLLFEGQDPELLPGDGIEVEREDAFAGAARRPRGDCSRRWLSS